MADVKILKRLRIALLREFLFPLAPQDLRALELFQSQLVVGIGELVGSGNTDGQDELVYVDGHLLDVDGDIALGGNDGVVVVDGLGIISQGVDLLAFLEAVEQLLRREVARTHRRREPDGSHD